MSIGQDTTTTKHKLLIGVSYSPDYCYRTLTRNDKSIPDSTWNSLKNFADSIETAKFGYTTGINICYYFNENLSIESGVLYSNKGDKTIPIKTFLIDSYGNVSPVNASFTSSYTYLDFPLTVNYTFFKKRIKLVVGVGATLSVYLNSTLTSDPKEALVLVVSDKFTGNKINISPTVSVGAQYQLNDKMSLRLAPTYRYGILGIYDADIKTHLWTVGINIGYYYKLK